MPTIDLPAGSIHYTDTGGDGPVVVFGHGLLMDSSVWRKVIPLLDGFRCIAPTLPMGAHRRPMKPDADLTELGVARTLADFLDALDLTDVTLVLNDWGGGQFVIPDGRSDRVGRLVMASCQAFEHFPPKPTRPVVPLFQLGGARMFMKLMGTRFFRHDPRTWGKLSKHGVPDEVLDTWFAPATRSAEIRRDLRKFATGTPPRRTLREWISRLSSFDRPVLVLWATEDKMFPVELAHRLVRTFPDARLVEIADSWTLLPEDQPEETASALRKFVSS